MIMLSRLPSSISLLPHLQGLQVEGNPLLGVRADIVRCGTVRLLRYLRERWQNEGNPDDGDVEQCTIPGAAGDCPSNFPDRYNILRAGRILSLANKNLNNVPQEAFEEAKAVDVSSVDLSRNIFSVVPTGLFCLGKTLKELNLASNRLTSVPPDLGISCPHLQFLDLQKNSLVTLPAELSSLSSLRELVIAFNKMKEIPSCIKELPSLEILFAQDNQIESLDLNILSGPRALTTLDLSNNDIHVVPPELGLMGHLRCLELSGNPFRMPRHSILSKGTTEILSYLRDRIPK